MSTATTPRQTVAIDPVTAAAAQLVREMLASTDGADLCAGVRAFDRESLDRMSDAVHALGKRIDDALWRSKMTANFGQQFAYTFDVVNAENRVTSAITIRARGGHRTEALRVMAANLLVENVELYGDGVRLSSDAPRVTPSPE